MNRSIFWRLVWKEYRLQRALWIAMAVLTALLLLAIFEFALNSTERAQWLFWVALGLPGFYFLGCGATLFAGEKEAGTYEFQRGLPLAAKRLFLAKITFALLSAAAMLALTWFLAFLLNGRKLPDAQQHLAMWGTVGVFGLEMLLWATLFSLLLKHVLLAAILGVTAASLTVQSLVPLVSLPPLSRVVLAMPWRAAVALLLALLSFRLGARWFRGDFEWRLRRPRPVLDVARLARSSQMAERVRAADRGLTFRRLLWQHWRQSIWPMLAIAAVIVLLAVFPSKWLIYHPPYIQGWRELWDKPLYGLALACVPLLGVCAFLADQRRKAFRFLADRGVPPKHVWRSRLLVSLAPVAVVLPVLLGFAYSLAPATWEFQKRVYHPATSMAFVLAYVVVGFAAGQLCSMFFRSTVLAGLFSVLAGAILTGWCGLMWFWQINWLWSVLPIPLCLLLATRLRTQGWLLERNTVRAWLLPVLAIALPAVALLTAVPLYRIYQVPEVGAPFSSAHYARQMTAAERATLELYRQARQHYRSSVGARAVNETPPLGERQPVWIDANREAIALALRASRGEFFDPFAKEMALRDLSPLAVLLAASAAKLEREGQLDNAIEHYFAALRVQMQMRQCGARGFEHADLRIIELCGAVRSWAARPGQTPQRIAAAKREFEQITQGPYDRPVGPILLEELYCVQPILLEYLLLEGILQGDPAALSTSRDRLHQLSVPTLLWLRLPWERQRALRVLRCQTFCDLLNAWADVPGRSIGTDLDSWAKVRRTLSVLPPLRETELLEVLRAEVGLPRRYDLAGNRISPAWEAYTATMTARRATQIVLALEVWKLEHGSLPESLDELPKSEGRELPRDPYSSLPFRYFPKGLPIPLRERHYRRLWTWRTPLDDVPANAPFIWAVGPEITTNNWVKDREDIADRYRIRVWDYYQDIQYCQVRPANSEYDIWEAGWPFPIP